MKVYSLIGFMDFEAAEMLGVFASVSDLLSAFEANKDSWNYDGFGYVESTLGQVVDTHNTFINYLEV